MEYITAKQVLGFMARDKVNSKMVSRFKQYLQAKKLDDNADFCAFVSQALNDKKLVGSLPDKWKDSTKLNIISALSRSVDIKEVKDCLDNNTEKYNTRIDTKKAITDIMAWYKPETDSKKGNKGVSKEVVVVPDDIDNDSVVVPSVDINDEKPNVEDLGTEDDVKSYVSDSSSDDGVIVNSNSTQTNVDIVQQKYDGSDITTTIVYLAKELARTKHELAVTKQALSDATKTIDSIRRKLNKNM